MHCRVSPLNYTSNTKTILSETWSLPFTKFLYYYQKGLWLASFLQVKVSVVNSGRFCWNMQLTLSTAIVHVPTSVEIMQFLRFYCNYVGGTFYCIYVGGSFCCNYTGYCFCCSYAVRSFCSIYAGESFCSKYVNDNFYWNYARGSLCCHYAGDIFYSALCSWLFLL